MELDLSKKNCLADNERYADLINGLLLDGKPQVKPEELQDMDTQGSRLIELLAGNKVRHRHLYRDLVKKVCQGVNFVVIGVENQEQVHYLMPVRCLSYDVSEYEHQARLLCKKVRRLKGLGRAEFLSGFRKNDKLKPCITLVLYYGEHWDGARSLHELLDFENISPQLQAYINDYPIHVFEIRKLENTEVFHTDLKQIFEFIKFSSDKKKLRQLVQNDPAYQEMDEDAYDMAVQYADATRLIDVKLDYEKEGKVNMCRALTEMLEDERMEGQLEAIKRVVWKMARKGKSDEEIMELTECSVELIVEVRDELKKEH